MIPTQGARKLAEYYDERNELTAAVLRSLADQVDQLEKDKRRLDLLGRIIHTDPPTMARPGSYWVAIHNGLDQFNAGVQWTLREAIDNVEE